MKIVIKKEKKEMIIKLLVDGGSMKPGPVISQKLGPMGLNLGKVISDVNAATADFSGMKVPVELDVDPKSKEYSVKVFSPPVSELLKKEAGVDKASGMAKKIKVANLSIEQLIKVSKTKEQNMLVKNLKAAVKSAAGSCVSLGIIIENKDPREIIEEIEKGDYDKEINGKIVETPKEKKAKLAEYFDQLKQKQDALLKKEEEAKAAKEEEEKAAKTAEGAAPAAETKEVKEVKEPKETKAKEPKK